MIITGIYGGGIAESVKYNVNTDSYEIIDYISSKNAYDVLNAVSVKNKLYTFVSEYTDDYNETLRSIPIESGLVDMNANIAQEAEVRDQNNNIINSGVSSYLPGQKVELTVTPKNGYKIKSFKVNGTPVNGNTFSCCITYNMNVEVESELITKNINGTNISGIKDKDYTGQPLTQKVVVKDGSTVLREGIDYYLNYSNNINPGKVTITITGIGNYSGSVKKYFNIVIPKVKGLKAASQTTTSIKLSIRI